MAEPYEDMLGGEVDLEALQIDPNAISNVLSSLSVPPVPTTPEQEPAQELAPAPEIPVQTPVPAPVQASSAPAPAPVQAPPAPVPAPQPVIDADAQALIDKPDAFIVMFGGMEFPFPAGTTDETISNSLEAFKNSKEFERIIDKESGASFTARAVVQPLDTVQEKLKTLRNQYPDAQLYGKDNFIFTDPGTGKFTLFDPPGFEPGEIAGQAKTITEMIGGGLGATAGFVSGLGTGPGAVLTSPSLAVLGAGLGTELSARFFDVAAGLIGGQERESKGYAGELTETATRFGLSAAGQQYGPVIYAAGKKMLAGTPTSAVNNAASALLQKFNSLGIEPVAGAIARKGPLPSAASGISSMAAGAPIMRRQAEKVLVQLNDAIKTIAGKMGGAIGTLEQTGAVIKAGVKASEKRIRDKFNEKYTEIFEEIGDDTLVESLPNVNAVLQPFLKEIAELPPEAKPTGALLSLVKKWDSLNLYSQTGNITFKELRDFRTQLRLVKKSSYKSNTPGDYDNAVEDIYKALTKDLSDAANLVNPNLGARLSALDAERKVFADGTQKTFDKINNLQANGQAYDYLIAASKGLGKDGVLPLQRLRKEFTPEEWSDVAASTLYNLGRENVGQQTEQLAEFSVATFMKNISAINKNGPTAMKELFGGTQFANVADDLKNLVDVVGALKEIKRFENPSGTAGRLNQSIMWFALADAAKSIYTGELLDAAVNVGATVVAPTLAARLLTFSPFVKWLATPASEITKNVSAHMGRLVAIGVAEPEMQPEIRQYIEAIKLNTGYTEPKNQGPAK